MVNGQEGGYHMGQRITGLSTVITPEEKDAPF